MMCPLLFNTDLSSIIACQNDDMKDKHYTELLP